MTMTMNPPASMAPGTMKTKKAALAAMGTLEVAAAAAVVGSRDPVPTATTTKMATMLVATLKWSHHIGDRIRVAVVTLTTDTAITSTDTIATFHICRRRRVARRRYSSFQPRHRDESI
jgi:hypothetical protein